ncbi:MFS transporter [Paenibacillus sp. GD4]|jgi:MFS family permease|uniref:staphylopine family metallophore export MFS transporter CntE n=1 Tax=Paenibacillus sp. GD4 TaxID=3068890 RepID=UPI0027969252|nr:MFS transporter [Paenibacillus sp. GD4]MDQ1913972.1 MFS transporter [Paenibacillus sp. GD4]
MISLRREGPFSIVALQIYLLALLFYTTSHVLLILLPLSASSLGASPSQIGLMMGGYMFISMFLRPVAGKLVDRFGRRRIFTVLLLLNVAVLSLYLIQELIVYAVLRMVQGAILAFFSMISHLMIIEALPDQSRGQGLTLFSLASMLPYAYGPLLIVQLVNEVPNTYLFIGLIGLGVTTLLVGYAVKLPEYSQAVGHNDRGKGALTDDYQAWKDKALWFPSLIMLLAGAVIGSTAAFLPLYLGQKHLPYTGHYFLTETLVLIALRLFGKRFVPTGGQFPKGLIGVLLLLLTAGAGFIGITNTLPLLLIAAACNGAALSMLYPSLVSYVSFIVPARHRGSGLGVFIAAADFGTSVGTMGLSFIAALYSYEAMFGACAAIGAISMIIAVLRCKGGHL